MDIYVYNLETQGYIFILHLYIFICKNYRILIIICGFLYIFLCSQSGHLQKMTVLLHSFQHSNFYSFTSATVGCRTQCSFDKSANTG